MFPEHCSDILPLSVFHNFDPRAILEKFPVQMLALRSLCAVLSIFDVLCLLNHAEQPAMITIDGWKLHVNRFDILNSRLDILRISAYTRFSLTVLNIQTSNFANKNLWVFCICVQKFSWIEWKNTKLQVFSFRDFFGTPGITLLSINWYHLYKHASFSLLGHAPLCFKY